jgi:hypothetical protein
MNSIAQLAARSARLNGASALRQQTQSLVELHKWYVNSFTSSAKQ